VIVTFENGNAEKPVSLGAMFNGKGKSGHGGAGNHIKGLQTRSGCHVLFNDQTGFTKLADHGQSNLAFDGSGNSSISTSTTQKINVGGGVDGEGNPVAPQSTLEMDNAGNITIKGDQCIKLQVGGSSITITEEDIKTIASTGKIEITALQQMDINSLAGKLSILALEYIIQSLTTGKVIALSGLSINGGIMTDIKSTLVKINT